VNVGALQGIDGDAIDIPGFVARGLVRRGGLVRSSVVGS